MADLRTSYTVLEDASTQAGLPLHKALSGESSSAKNAHGAFSYTDAAGNFQYAKVNANREVIVSLESADLASLSDFGTIAGNASFTAVATIALVVDAVYRDITLIPYCTRDAQFKLVWDDDGAETDLTAPVGVNAGQVSDDITFGKLTFTAGASGSQNLIVYAKNLNAPSDLHATIALEEIQ